MALRSPSDTIGRCRRYEHHEERSATWTYSRLKKEVRSVLEFIRGDEGQGLVEYALIIAVIAIAVIVAMIFVRGQLQNLFSDIGNNLT